MSRAARVIILPPHIKRGQQSNRDLREQELRPLPFEDEVQTYEQQRRKWWITFFASAVATICVVFLFAFPILAVFLAIALVTAIAILR